MSLEDRLHVALERAVGQGMEERELGVTLWVSE
jgi:hypothetical protein